MADGELLEEDGTRQKEDKRVTIWAESENVEEKKTNNPARVERIYVQYIYVNLKKDYILSHITTNRSLEISMSNMF